jgi:hypothetical protein
MSQTRVEHQLECSKWSIEIQAFSRSYDLAPRQPSRVIKHDRRYTGRQRKRDNLQMGKEGWGGGRGAESYDQKKAWSSINHSILSGHSLWLRIWFPRVWSQAFTTENYRFSKYNCTVYNNYLFSRNCFTYVQYDANMRSFLRLSKTGVKGRTGFCTPVPVFVNV